MKPAVRWVLVCLAVAAAGGAGYYVGHRGAAASGTAESPKDSPATQPEGPVATVTTVPLRRGTIEEKITAYGTVVSQLGEVRAISVPVECRIARMLVTPGQQVAAGAALVDVEPSAATRLALQEAQNAATAAERDLAQVQQRFDQKLATNQELNAARTGLQSARSKLDSLQKSGAAGLQELKSDAAGIVSKVDVQVGQIVAPGTPLVEVAAENRIEVRLGAEPGDASHLREGQPVSLLSVNQGPGGAPVEGRIRLITQRVNPDTRLVDVFVALPPGAKLILEGYVRGDLTLRSAEGLIVPRDAALPAAGGYALFTVENGRAVAHSVQIGLDNDAEIQVEGPGLKEGQPVVSVGNYELEDGMAVEAREARPPSPATRPATGPTTEAAP